MKNNHRVKGRILDKDDKPFQGLVVVAKGAGRTEYEVRDSNVIKLADRITPVSLKKDYELGKSKTDENGLYKILYSPNQYKNFLNENPDIWVVIKDTLDVTELFITDKYPDVSETIKKIDDISIHRNWAEGWFVTLGGSEKSRFTKNNHLEILIDNQVELESLVESINKSKSYVYLTQIEFDPDFVATFTSDNFDEVNPKDILVDVLQKAALSS